MKYVTFAIMAVLIFGVAVAPAFSNGVAFAQTQKEVAIEKKENTAGKKEASEEKKKNSDDKKQASEVRKENSVDKKQASEEKKANSIDKKASTAEKKQISEEKRRAYNEEQKAHLKEKFANMHEWEKQALQSKLDIMKEKRGSNTQSSQHTGFVNLSVEDKEAKLQEIRDKRSAEREARNNMTPEERQAHQEERIAAMKEKRENYVSPRDQIGLGLAPEDVICADDKELVIRISNGNATCLGPDAVFVLMDRGIIAYPE